MIDSSSIITRQPESPEVWHARLQQGGCFIVAEAAMNDKVPWLAGRYGGNKQQSCLFWGKFLRQHASAAPYCIPLTAENWSVVSEQIITVPEWGIAIQLEYSLTEVNTAQQLVELVHHLRNCTMVQQPDGEPFILRFTDWRVLIPLLEASSDEEICALYGPVQRFFNIAPEGGIQSVTLTRRTPAGGPVQPFRLTERQWQAISARELTGLQARFVAHLRKYHACWQQADDKEMLLFIDQHCSQARQYGFTSELDQMRWLALASELAEDFIHSAWAQAVLAEPQQKGTSGRMDRLYEQAVRQMQQG